MRAFSLLLVLLPVVMCGDMWLADLNYPLIEPEHRYNTWEDYQKTIARDKANAPDFLPPIHNCEESQSHHQGPSPADLMPVRMLENKHYIPDEMDKYASAVYAGFQEICENGFGYTFSEGQLLAFLLKNKDEVVRQTKKFTTIASLNKFYTKDVLHCRDIAHTAVEKINSEDIARAAARAIHDNRHFLPDEPKTFAKRTYYATNALCKSHDAPVFPEYKLVDYVSKNRYALKEALDSDPTYEEILSRHNRRFVTVLCSAVVHGSYEKPAKKTVVIA